MMCPPANTIDAPTQTPLQCASSEPSISSAGSTSTVTCSSRPWATSRYSRTASSSSWWSAVRTAARTSTSILARSFSTSSKAASRSPPCRTANSSTFPSAKARSSCCRPTCHIRRAVPPIPWDWSSSARVAPGERDGFQWYCENCHRKLYEEFLEITNIETQLPPVFDRFFGAPDHLTCRNCGTVMQRPGQPER